MDASDKFDVVILGFEPRQEPPEARLQRVFGIDATAAAQLVTGLPKTVQRAVSSVRAEYFRRALVLLGAAVEVRDPQGRVVGAQAQPEVIAERVSSAAAFNLVGMTDPAPPPATRDLSIDPMSRTLAPATAPRHLDWAAPIPPGGARADHGDQVFRAPAHPTVREVLAPLSQPNASNAEPPPLPDLELETTDPNPSWPRAASSAWGAPVTPLAEADPIQAPREPSSVWDPAPKKPEVRAVEARVDPMPAPVEGVARIEPRADPDLARLQAPVARPQSARPPEPARPKAAASFDIAKSVAFNPLWRPPSTADSAAAMPASAVTLDDDPGAAARRVLSPWEQPNAESMAEPKPQPASKAPEPIAGARARVRAAPGKRVVAPPAQPAGDRPVAATAEAASEPPTARRPAAVGVPTRGAHASVSKVDLRSFWETFGEGLALPFSGPGLRFIAVISAWSVLVGLLDLISRVALIVGSLVMFSAHASLLAMACDYYHGCMWTSAAGNRALDRGPELDPTRIFDRYLKSGMSFLLFMLASQCPVLWWVFHELGANVPPGGILIDPLTWLLALLPYVYWPMGVGLATLRNDPSAIWKVSTGARAIMRAPLEYMVIVLVGLIAFSTSWGALLACGAIFGVTGPVLSGTLGFPLAISHGLQGALMGHLVRARAEVFE